MRKQKIKNFLKIIEKLLKNPKVYLKKKYNQTKLVIISANLIIVLIFLNSFDIVGHEVSINNLATSQTRQPISIIQKNLQGRLSNQIS